MASGDQHNPVKDIASKLGFKTSNYRSQLSPEQKADWIAKHKKVLFVGDGINDTLAFSKAYTSIAIKGSLDIGLTASDAYINNKKIEIIPKIILMANSGLKTIKRNLAFSIIYNIIGAILSLLGFIGPLEAAVLMPISSLTVLCSTLVGTRESLFIKT